MFQTNLIRFFRKANAIPREKQRSNKYTLGDTPKCNVRSKTDDSLLQFTRNIAFRCVLHRYENQEIHC